MFKTRNLTGLTPIVAALALAACGDSTGPDAPASRTVTLSVATTGGTTVGGSAGTSLGSITIGSGSELVITKAQVVLREIELESYTLGCASDDSDDDSSSTSFSAASYSRGGDDDCGEIELGPVLVTLPLGGSPSQVTQVSIPEGTYHEIEFDLREPDDDTAEDRAFRSANPEFAELSVRVEGTYNGQPFTWTSAMRADLEREFSPPVVIGAEAANVTLQVDVASWFRDGSGNAINPASAQGATAARTQVEANIAGSFGAFQDDDRDGRSGGDDDDNDD